MPHKHKRQKTGDGAQYNLAPTSNARAIPVKHASSATRNGKGKRPRDNDDDTPKAFKRLMELRRTGKGLKGLDEGKPKVATGAKRKRGSNAVGAAATNDTEARADTQEVEAPVSALPLKIQPGERLGDFAARVDQSLPISGLITKSKVGEGPNEQRNTKHNKRLQKLVNNWKAEETKRIEKAQEEYEEAEEEAEEKDAQWELQMGVNGGRKGKKGKRRGSDDEDPWEELKKRRDKPKGIFDVVQAPPQFTKLPKDFKVKDGAKVNISNVPNTGSLARQEMLSETRKDVIARYRAMMQAKRGA